MRLSSIRVGDIVECDVRGRRFHAIVVAPDDDSSATSSFNELTIKPMVPAITYHHVSARQVVGHWRKSGRRA